MATLQQDRFQEVAQFIAAQKKLELFGTTFLLGHKIFEGNFLGAWKQAFEKTGLSYEEFISTDGGQSVAQDLWALKALIAKGEVSAAEAKAYVTTAHGGAFEFGGLAFNQAPAPEAEVFVVDSEQPLEGEDGHLSLSQRSAAIVQELGKLGLGGGAFTRVQLYAPEPPEEYDQGAELRFREELLTQLEIALGELKSGHINYRINSIDGSALQPGSVPFHKIEPVSVLERVQSRPGADQAITLRLAHDSVIDRWHSAGNLSMAAADGSANVTREIEGPGRVWRVTGWDLPRDYLPGPGPTRYRLVVPTMRLGLMCIHRMLDRGANLIDHAGNNAHYELVYGAVIKGLPNFFARAPQRIEAVYVGDCPVDLKGHFNSVSSGNLRLYSQKADNVFRVAGRPLLEPYNLRSASANYQPSQASLDALYGWNISLVTGRTATEVYPQLNGRVCHWGRIGEYARAPMAQLNDIGYEGDPTILAGSGFAHPRRWPRPMAPTVASVVMSDGGAYSNAVMRSESDGTPIPNGSGSDRVVHGVPFTYADCEKLVPSSGPDGTFSVAVEPQIHRVVQGPQVAAWQASLTSDMRPGAWWTTGARVVQGGGRQTFIDIIVS